MAKAINFPTANIPFTAPGCHTLPVDVRIEPLYSILVEAAKIPAVLLKGKVFVSCWQLDTEEINALIANGGKVYLHIVGMQPPVYVSSHSPEEHNLFDSPVAEVPVDPKSN